MNDFLSHLIQVFTTHLIDVQAILLYGSRRAEDQTDFWSDYDVVVVLKPDKAIDKPLFLKSISCMGSIIGSESYGTAESILYRTSIDYNHSIQLLDVSVWTHEHWLTQSGKAAATVLHGSVELIENCPSEQVEHSFHSYENRMTEVWFTYFIAIKKIARHDHLIGLHLLLDLIREYLVVEMIERDMSYKTNIHKYGYNEQLPDSIKLTELNETSAVDMLNYVKRLAYEYDQKLINYIPSYRSRYDQVAKYIEDSKRQLL